MASLPVPTFTSPFHLPNSLDLVGFLREIMLWPLMGVGQTILEGELYPAMKATCSVLTGKAWRGDGAVPHDMVCDICPRLGSAVYTGLAWGDARGTS